MSAIVANSTCQKRRGCPRQMAILPLLCKFLPEMEESVECRLSEKRRMICLVGVFFLLLQVEPRAMLSRAGVIY